MQSNITRTLTRLRAVCLRLAFGLAVAFTMAGPAQAQKYISPIEDPPDR